MDDEPLGSQARLDALYGDSWRQWVREHDAKMTIDLLTKQVAKLELANNTVSPAMIAAALDRFDQIRAHEADGSIARDWGKLFA